jgi:uncharacterized protein
LNEKKFDIRNLKKDKRCIIIGMVHLLPLPGTPNYDGSIDKIYATALGEAKIYAEAGIDAILIENMHDVPYLKIDVGPEISSTMAVICHEIKKSTCLPTGIQILAGANKPALAVAKAANLDFIRAEGFVFGHLADEGYFDSCAGELLRYRKTIDAEYIAIFTDIKKKHSSHALTSDVNIVETAIAAEYFLSDGLILTGTSTGKEADLEEVKSVKDKVHLPVIIGSGVTLANVENYFENADALIIGSYFKHEGKWNQPLSKEKITEFMSKINHLRKKYEN